MYSRDYSNPVRKEAKLVIDLMTSSGTIDEVLHLVSASADIAVDMSQVNREAFEEEIIELARERIIELTCPTSETLESWRRLFPSGDDV